MDKTEIILIEKIEKLENEIELTETILQEKKDLLKLKKASQTIDKCFSVKSCNLYIRVCEVDSNSNIFGEYILFTEDGNYHEYYKYKLLSLNICTPENEITFFEFEKQLEKQARRLLGK